MSADLEQLRRIHRIDTDLVQAIKEVKTITEARTAQIEDLPEYKTLLETEAAVAEAKARFKIAVRDDRDLAKLEVKLAEAKFQRRDLAEMLSHHLMAYHDETGRDVVKDRESRVRQIEFHAKYGKPTLDQERLPLGINRHLGERQAIPDDRRIEREGAKR